MRIQGTVECCFLVRNWMEAVLSLVKRLAEAALESRTALWIERAGNVWH